MPTTSNFGWTTPADTDLVKDGASAIRTLGNGIDTSFIDLKGGTTGQILAKASNTDLDFSWIANDQGDITAVTAGVGITGGGTTGSVTITNDMATTITASGDIVVGTGNGTYDNLPIGTTGQVLTADTTVSPYKVKWASPSAAAFVGVSAYKSTATSLTADNVVILDLPSESWDTDGFHSTSTNNSRITIPSGKAGKYLLIMQITTQTAGTIIGYFYKNGGNVPEIGTGNNTIFRNSNTGGGTTGWTGSIVVDAAVGDYFEAAAYSAGTTKNTDGQTFQAIYLGA